MSYKNGGNPYRPATDPKVVHFIRYYLKHVGIRHAPDRPSHVKPEEIIDSLHNLRIDYDRWGLGLKRIDTKLRYYKRVRDDAPFASKLPNTINCRVDWLRKIGIPAKVIPLVRQTFDERAKL